MIIGHTTKHWEFNEALQLFRHLQEKAHAINWALAMGGSVINKGESYKDLDIVAHPFHLKNYTPNEYDIIKMFENELGAEARDGDPRYDGDEARFDKLVVLQWDQVDGSLHTNCRIDLFIFGVQ